MQDEKGSSWQWIEYKKISSKQIVIPKSLGVKWEEMNDREKIMLCCKQKGTK